MQSENLVESVEGRHNARGEDAGTSDEEKGDTNAGMGGVAVGCNWSPGSAPSV